MKLYLIATLDSIGIFAVLFVIMFGTCGTPPVVALTLAGFFGVLALVSRVVFDE